METLAVFKYQKSAGRGSDVGKFLRLSYARKIYTTSSMQERYAPDDSDPKSVHLQGEGF
jgi:hypothetical protein